MRTAAQYARQKRIQMREERLKSLAIVDVARASADQRYVRDFVGWIWPNVLRRYARELAGDLPLGYRRRILTLLELEQFRELRRCSPAKAENEIRESSPIGSPSTQISAAI